MNLLFHQQIFSILQRGHISATMTKETKEALLNGPSETEEETNLQERHAKDLKESQMTVASKNNEDEELESQPTPLIVGAHTPSSREGNRNQKPKQMEEGFSGWMSHTVDSCCAFFRRLFRNEEPPTSLISAFRREKLLFEFNAFIDVNHDGQLEHDDFVAGGHRLCKRRNWTADDPRAIRVFSLLDQIWLALRRHADFNQDNVVTRKEWIRMWEEAENAGKKTLSALSVVKADEKTPLCEASATLSHAYFGQKQLYPTWMREYFNYKFNILDVTGDGVIDEDEFIFVISQYGGLVRVARKAWILLAQGRNTIDQEYFQELCEQFFLSDDPTVPGTYLAGKLFFLPGNECDREPFVYCDTKDISGN